MEPDRISCLPSHVTDQILSLLPIREAVRTSVLSSNWRYKWTTCPDLVFDDQCISEALKDPSVIGLKLSIILDIVLSRHSGPINKFELSHSGCIGIDNNRWALRLFSSRSVREFVWEICNRRHYRIPSCLFACQSLVNLVLYNCVVKPPSTFRGFGKLKSLHLMEVTMPQDVFEVLISSCPLLERLKLERFDDYAHLNIDAPNLLYFEFIGNFEHVSFKNSFHLEEVSFYMDFDFKSDLRASSESSSNLLKLVVQLPRVRRLEACGCFLKFLAIGVVPTKLPMPCIDLNYLFMHLNFNDSKDISAALCLLRSSPNLQEIEILADWWSSFVLGTHTYRWEEDCRGCPFMQLEFVTIVYMMGRKRELDFIRFLLTHSPGLQRMTVKGDKRLNMNEKLELMKELLQFERASPRAQILYMES